MANPFDQFDGSSQVSQPAQKTAPNPFDKFDASQSSDNVMNHMSTGESLLAGIGKGMVDVGRGAGQRLGLVSQQEIDQAKALDAPLMGSTSGQVGNVIGNVAAALPTMAIPGAGTIAGSAAIGAGLGLAQPTATGESVAGNVALGGAGGALGAAVPRVLARIVNPNAVARVSSAVGDVTPGQALGGVFKTAEEKATSLPIAGTAIRNAQQDALKSFNNGVLNKVLEPIGQTTDQIGHQGVQDVGDLISNSYKKLLPKLKIEADPQFNEQISGVKNLITSGDLPTDKADQLGRIIDNQVLSKFTDSGLMSGDTMKQVDSKLGQMIRGYISSPDYDTRQMGNALRETQSALRSMVERNNPDQAGQLQNINNAFSQFIRVERASSGVGAKEGIFTPAQLNSAAKATDSSLRKGAFARGSALMQDVAQQGQQTIGSTYPDSGTAGRMLTSLPAMAAYISNPMLMAGEGALAGTYASPTVRNALVSLIGRRPAGAANVAQQLRLASPALGRIGAISGAAYANQK